MLDDKRVFKEQFVEFVGRLKPPVERAAAKDLLLALEHPAVIETKRPVRLDGVVVQQIPHHRIGLEPIVLPRSSLTGRREFTLLHALTEAHDGFDGAFPIPESDGGHD